MRLTPRRRYLLQAAYEGRIWADHRGAYWLDKHSNVTPEFKPLVSADQVRDPRPSNALLRRVVWISEDAPIERVPGE